MGDRDRLERLIGIAGMLTSSADGQTWDLPVSDAILPRVMCSSTPAGWTGPRMTVPPMLRSITKTISAPTSRQFRGSITHPTQQLCTLRGRRYRRLTQHSPPGGSLRLTWTGLAPANRASLLAPSLVSPKRRDVGLRMETRASARNPVGEKLGLLRRNGAGGKRTRQTAPRR